MPRLTWDSKKQPAITPAEIRRDSVVYPAGAGYPQAEPGRRLFWGDNLAVMAALLEEYAGRVDLIYADPPFFTNRKYNARIGRDEDSRRPRDWQLADGYLDHWPDLEAYLDMLYPRLVLMHRLLAPTGSLYLHLDWHANAYARVLLDEIFGPECLLNEIVWVYHGPSPIRSAFNRKHDTILVYTKSNQYYFDAEAVRTPYNPSTVKTFESSPKAGFGKVPDLERGKVPEDWWYFPVVARLHNERTGYPTQKPEALLERIMLASSRPGDLVLDPFSGAGTTALVAARHARRCLAIDAAWRAVQTSRSRLVEGQGDPFALDFALQAGSPSPDEATSTPSWSRFEARWQDHLLVLEPPLGEALDYWEIDPDWDGVIFKSAIQGVRPRRKGALPTLLEVPPSTSGRPVCLRLMDPEGVQIQRTLERPAA